MNNNLPALAQPKLRQAGLSAIGRNEKLLIRCYHITKRFQQLPDKLCYLWYLHFYTRYGSSNYYPFGMLMPSRTYQAPSTDDYRFGFQGQERDDEVKGEGNSYTTDFRQLDVRLGRWLAVDPMSARGPGLSPYLFAFDNPNKFVDRNGLWPWEGKNVRAARKEARKTDGEFRKWKKDGQTYASVTKGIDGGVQAHIFRPTSAVKTEMSNAGAALIAPVATGEAIVGLKALLEGTGVELSKDVTLARGGTLSPMLLYATIPLVLRSDKPSIQQRMQQIDQQLSEALASGDIYRAQEIVDNYNNNGYGNHYNNRIVFRYISVGEKNGIKGKNLYPEGPDGQFTGKFISPDLYVSSSYAKSKLALPTAPSIMVWTYETLILQTKMPAGPGNYAKVKANEDGPGGGNEALIFQTFPVRGIAPLLK